MRYVFDIETNGFLHLCDKVHCIVLKNIDTGEILTPSNEDAIKLLEDAELIIVDLEVNLGDEVRSAPTLCARYKGKIIPLNTAHDGRPILMKDENSIDT